MSYNKGFCSQNFNIGPHDPYCTCSTETTSFANNFVDTTSPKLTMSTDNGKCENLTAVLHGINDLRLEQRSVPQPRDNEVLLQMESVGICGSDIHYLVNGRIGHFVVTKPMVIGHEASGTVLKVGCKVKSLQPGDRVALEPGVPCRICDYCRSGKYNLCPEMRFCATPPIDGNLCRYYVHPEDYCFKLPNHVSLDEGALLEPLSVGVHACKKGNVKFGTSLVILGSGPIGLVTLATAKAFGASKIIITDISEYRLRMAKKLGADHALRINPCDNDEAIMDQIISFIGGQPDVTIECSGAEQSMRIAVQLTKSGGIAVMVGMGKPEATLPLISALAREVDIRGCFRYCNDYGDALNLIASGRVNLKPLITHHFRIDDTAGAFKTAQCQVAQAIKVMIHPNPAWCP